jgi:hypothetical protein
VKVSREGELRGATKEAAEKPKPPKRSRVPKPRAGGEFSDARFFGFLRSGLRQMSRRWPPLVRQIWLEHRLYPSSLFLLPTQEM